MQRFEVAHITFEVDEKEKTFALIAGKAMQAKDRKPLSVSYTHLRAHET